MHPSRKSRRIQYTLGLCFVAFGGLACAQGTVPNPLVTQCNSTLTPAPCPLLESVMTTCANTDGENYVVPNLNTQSRGVYPAPAANATALEKCQCTNVGYNLYAACAACQVGNDIAHWLSREDWFAGCIANSSESQIALAPLGPATENISLWMKQIYNPTFSISQALEVQASNALLSTTTLATPATETISANSGNPSNTVKGSPGSGIISSGSTTNNTGIIAGAVVGAFALLATIALGIIFCIRRRQRQERWLKRGPIIL